ncbi:MAG: hypothetical protein AAFV29_12615, partial [Myxococcota bacterium]
KTHIIEDIASFDASHLSLPEGANLLYVLRDRATGAVVKVGVTDFTAHPSRGSSARFQKYKRAASDLEQGLRLEVTEVTDLHGQTRDQSETTLRERLERESHIMPWDYEGQRMGRVGRGVPFEHPIRKDLKAAGWAYATAGVAKGYLVPPGGGTVQTPVEQNQLLIARAMMANPDLRTASAAAVARAIKRPERTVRGWMSDPDWRVGLQQQLADLEAANQQTTPSSGQSDGSDS